MYSIFVDNPHIEAASGARGGLPGVRARVHQLARLRGAHGAGARARQVQVQALQGGAAYFG